MASSDNDRQLYELKIFHDVAKALTSTLDLDTILQTIMEKMAAYFEPATWSLVMIDESSLEPYYAASVGKGPEGLAALRLADGSTLTEWVIAHGEALVIENVNADPLIDPDSRSEWFDGSLPGGLRAGADRGKRPGRHPTREHRHASVHPERDAAANARRLRSHRHRKCPGVRRIQELSITDDCTGLYNARHLFTVLSDEVHRSARFGYEFTLLFLDLDHFKRVNDEHGHIIGSKLLAQVGECLRENLRLVDAAFRYGGDEFAILLPQTSREAGLRVARRISRVFRQRRWLPDEHFRVELRASIGLATYPEDANSARRPLCSAPTK